MRDYRTCEETHLFISSFFVFFSLRPRASSSSSQSERSASPLVMNSTQSLDIMPRFAVAAEEEGAKGNWTRTCTRSDSPA